MALAVSSPTLGIGRLVVRPAVLVSQEASLREASALMERADVSALLVGGPTGIVTERDLIRAWGAGATGDETVTEVASYRPIIVDAATPIADAAAAMLNRGVRHLIVVMPDGSLGIASLRTVTADLLQALQPQPWLTSLRVDAQITA